MIQINQFILPILQIDSTADQKPENSWSEMQAYQL